MTPSPLQADKLQDDFPAEQQIHGSTRLVTWFFRVIMMIVTVIFVTVYFLFRTAGTE